MTTNFTDFGNTLAPNVRGRANDRPGNLRTVHLSDGMEVKVEQRDPYGQWHFVWGSGSVPDYLSGSYTSPDFALRALDIYLNKEKYNTKRVEVPVEKTPPLAYKKPKDGKTFSV